MSSHLPLFVAKNEHQKRYDFFPSSSQEVGSMRTIGRIIQKHNLYARIRDDEHIDIFGAEMNQLAEICQDLIDAGLRTENEIKPN